jgi:hypothetical protein
MPAPSSAICASLGVKVENKEAANIPHRHLETRKGFYSRSLTRCLVVFVAPTIIVALVVEQILEYVEEKTLTTNDTFIEFGGNKIRYLQIGPGSGANVVFIAGMGHSREESLPLAQEVSVVASTLAYDCRGRGFSHSDTGQ